MGAEAQGLQVKRYHVVPRTLIFLTRREQEILLLKGAPNKRLWAGLYNGVGGHIQPGEDVLRAAQRELREETGLTANLWMCCVVTIDVTPQEGVVLFVFRGEPRNPDAPLRPSAEGSLAWVPLEQWQTLPLVEDLPTLLPRVLASRPSQPPFFAHYTYDGQGKLQIAFSP